MRSSPHGAAFSVDAIRGCGICRSAGAMPTYAAPPPLRVAWSPLRGERKGLRPGAFTGGKMAAAISPPAIYNTPVGVSFRILQMPIASGFARVAPFGLAFMVILW